MGLDDNNLEREEVEVESAQLVNNGRTECGQWIPPSHISLSSKLANTLLVDICWWKCFLVEFVLNIYILPPCLETQTHTERRK